MELLSVLNAETLTWPRSMIVRQGRPSRNVPRTDQFATMGSLGPQFRHNGHMSLQMADYRDHRGIIASLTNAERIANMAGSHGRAPSPEHVEVEQLLEQSNASPQRKALVDARRRLDQITHAKLQLQRTESSEAMHGTYVNVHRGDATAIAPANNSGCSPTTGAHQPHMPTRHAAYRHRYVVNTHFGAPSPPPGARDSASASARIRGRSRGRDSRGVRGSAGGGLTTEPIAPPLPRPPSRTSRVPLRPATLGFATNTAEAAGDAALHPTVARAMGRKEASVLMPGEDDTDTYSALFPQHRKSTVSKVAGLIQVRAVSASNRSGRVGSGRRAGSARFNSRKGTQVGSEDAWAVNAAKMSFEKKRSRDTTAKAMAVARGERARVLDGLLFHTAVQKDGRKGETKTTTSRTAPNRFANRPPSTASARLRRARQVPNVTGV